jgi:2-C-methyl-D-erythritol 2,4-cyclodiphosphate synthase
VNIKGKTHEKVDALGENRAIACHAVVLLTPAAC